MAAGMQGEAKEEMMLAMGLNTEEEGSAMAFLRRGYKARLPLVWRFPLYSAVHSWLG